MGLNLWREDSSRGGKKSSRKCYAELFAIAWIPYLKLKFALILHKKHTSVLSRNTLYDNEILSLIQAFNVFAITYIDDCIDQRKLKKRGKARACIDIYNLCQVFREEKEKNKISKQINGKHIIPKHSSISNLQIQLPDKGCCKACWSPLWRLHCS